MIYRREFVGRLVQEERWQPVKIEFEYKSRNFLRHMHNPEGCDLIVCWSHNWPECPLEVIELKTAIRSKTLPRITPINTDGWQGSMNLRFIAF
jgi:hypothetical protein